MTISWICYKYPHGDEYLVIFMIPLLYVIAPFFMEWRITYGMLVLNLMFFLFYVKLGALNPVDLVVLIMLLSAVSGFSYLARYLYESFISYHGKDITKQKRKYNNIVNELETVDQRGEKIENELSRISRLYGITKKLAPVLRIDDLLEALFNFLEENFSFQVTHLLTVQKGKIIRKESKSVGGEDYYADKNRILDYEKVLEVARKHDMKPFFLKREDNANLFDLMKVRADTFMLFPLSTGDKLCAIFAIEGVSKASYGRFRILISQIALEFRKVELYEQVQQLSIMDGLTEVYLRRYLMTRLEEEVERASRLGLTFSVGMVDVDRFKQCNDKYGHLVGDVVLKRIAGRMKKSVREVDMIARYGGEEFCLVLPDTSKDVALSVMERLRESIDSKSIQAFGDKTHMTISVGIATYPEDGEEVDELLKMADTALYKAKRKGRNTVCTV